MTDSDREQRPRCPELAVVQLRIIKIVPSIGTTLLTIYQVL
ncbi:hypothetical protein [Halalkalicoccus subterraneus]|nr:hypothetical protein [Halalkalicoccus subterraneus]